MLQKHPYNERLKQYWKMYEDSGGLWVPNHWQIANAIALYGKDIPRKYKQQYYRELREQCNQQMYQDMVNKLLEWKVEIPYKQATGPNYAKVKWFYDFLEEQKEKDREVFAKCFNVPGTTPKRFLAAYYFHQQNYENFRMAAKKAGLPYVKVESMANVWPGFWEVCKLLEGLRMKKVAVTVDEVVEWFKEIAKAAFDSGDYANANRAMENLGKYLQMFTERKEITFHNIVSKADLDAQIQEYMDILREAKDEPTNDQPTLN